MPLHLFHFELVTHTAASGPLHMFFPLPKLFFQATLYFILTPIFGYLFKSHFLSEAVPGRHSLTKRFNIAPFYPQLSITPFWVSFYSIEVIIMGNTFHLVVSSLPSPIFLLESKLCESSSFSLFFFLIAILSA